MVLPGAVLPGGFEISARKTYGHVSAGMICSRRELGLGDDHDGILVLPADAGAPGDDAFEVLHLRDDVIEMEINPDRAYALSLRGVAREAALGFGAPSPTRPTARSRRADDDGYPVGSTTPRAARSSSPARSPASTRPRPRPAGWPAGSSSPACGRSRWRSTSRTT